MTYGEPLSNISPIFHPKKTSTAESEYFMSERGVLRKKTISINGKQYYKNATVEDIKQAEKRGEAKGRSDQSQYSCGYDPGMGKDRGVTAVFERSKDGGVRLIDLCPEQLYGIHWLVRMHGFRLWPWPFVYKIKRCMYCNYEENL
jgi:hypothetical protein